MQALRSRPGLRRGGILYLSTDELLPNPVQPRRNFDGESLAELSESIKNYGILNPLTVRLRGGRYELVAGERRLRAAKLAGLAEVPCLLVDVNMEDASDQIRIIPQKRCFDSPNTFIIHDYDLQDAIGEHAQLFRFLCARSFQYSERIRIIGKRLELFFPHAQNRQRRYYQDASDIRKLK